jgi:hypothetical protein
LSSPAGVFSAELSALFMALRHIREVIQPPEKCLILTDSLSSIRAMLFRRISWRTHPLVYECKQLCFDLMKFMWIPFHVEFVGNELVNGEARNALLNGSIFDRLLGKTSFVKGNSRQSGICHTLGDLLTPFYRKYHYVHCSRVRRRRRAFLPLYL